VEGVKLGLAGLFDAAEACRAAEAYARSLLTST